MNLVVFDFCETLVPFQSADAFVNFVVENIPENKGRKKWSDSILNSKVVVVFFNKFFPTYNFSKRKVVAKLKGIEQNEVEKLAIEYSEKLGTTLIPELMDKFYYHKSIGDEIIIISGGYEIYLKHFAEKFGFNACYATKIKFSNNRCTGAFAGNDCMFDQKVTYAEEYKKAMKTKPNRTIVYTDSESDIKLMQWADEGIVVSKSPQLWAKKFNFNEIIWK